MRTAPDHFLGDYPAVKWQAFAHAIPEDLSGKTVLDVGCNAGFYSLEMKRRGASRVVGIDSDETYLQQARFAAEVCGAEIDFRRMSVYEVARLGERFDLVIFMGVLYHLRHPLLALDLLRQHVVGDLLIFQSMLRGSAEVEPLQNDYPFEETSIFDKPGFPGMGSWVSYGLGSMNENLPTFVVLPDPRGLLLVGVDGCRSYLRMLLFFADNSTSAATGLKSWKYIDINSFSRLLFPELPGLRWGLVAVVLAIMLPLLARLWWRAASRPESQSLVWASAITWTLVLNLYLGIYDATLAALAALLVCDLWRRDAPPFSPPRRLLLLALYLVPWITQPLAKLTGVQTLTLTLALFGAWQLVMLRQREIARPRRGGIDFSHG